MQGTQQRGSNVDLDVSNIGSENETSQSFVNQTASEAANQMEYESLDPEPDVEPAKGKSILQAQQAQANIPITAANFGDAYLTGSNLKAIRTKIGGGMTMLDNQVKNALNINYQARTFSRATITLTHTYTVGNKAYQSKFTIAPGDKDLLWADILKHLTPLLNSDALLAKEHALFLSRYSAPPSSDTYARNSTVDTSIESSASFRYYASRIIRAIRKYASAFYGEAERYWTSAEGIAKRFGFFPIVRGGLNRKTPIERAMAKLDRDTMMTEVTTINKRNELLVKGKKLDQFSSILYVTDNDLRDTKRKLICDAYGTKDASRFYNIDKVDKFINDIVYMSSSFDQLNKAQASRGGSMHIPDVPFYVIDAVGIWDISKSLDRPNLKPISISSIAGLRMPFICGTHGGTVINGKSPDYINISAKIDVGIVNMKSLSYASARTLIEDLGRFIMGDNYRVRNVKLVRKPASLQTPEGSANSK